MQYTYAKRMRDVRASEIRELLKLTESPEIISFSGGLPSPDLFPVEDLKKVSLSVLEKSGRTSLQYTTTEGYAPLRRWVAERMNRRLGTSFSEDEVLLTHGSQQAIDLSGKVFLDEGDVDRHIERIRADYRAKRDIMLETMDALFPEGVQYTRPQGGLFAWVTLPEYLDAREILAECLKEKVAFVPGGSFFPNGGHQNTLRINFSFAAAGELREGIARIARVLERHIR